MTDEVAAKVVASLLLKIQWFERNQWDLRRDIIVKNFTRAWSEVEAFEYHGNRDTLVKNVSSIIDQLERYKPDDYLILDNMGCPLLEEFLKKTKNNP